jgi:predicted Ser/Thr protein kinase
MSASSPAGLRFTREAFLRSERTLLSQGRWPKATVWKARVHGVDWIVKDARSRDWLTRNLIGALLVRREARALQRLDGLPCVPPNGFAIDRHALAYRFTPGRPMADLPDAEQTTELFMALEQAMHAIHARRVIHLDVRNRENILVTDAGSVLLIDFESNLDTARLPARLGRALERFDLGGAYKHWARVHPETLGDERREVLEWTARRRRLWPFRGVWHYTRAARRHASRLFGQGRARTPGGGDTS